MNKRASGILMHISSLPGKFGIGTFENQLLNLLIF